MKCIRKEFIIGMNQIGHTMTERNLLSSLTSHFTVQMEFAFQTEDKLYFVLEFVSGGDLLFHIKQRASFTEEMIRFYVAEIALALELLHSKGVIYRDLKPENLLLDEDGHIKVSDFGLSKEGLDQQNKMTYSVCGTLEYIAPEIFNCQGYT